MYLLFHQKSQLKCKVHDSWCSFRIFLYFTFKKHYQILPRVLVDSIQVGRNTLWPQAADQGDPCFIKLRMFAPHEPGKAENDLKKHFNSFLFSIILGDTKWGWGLSITSHDVNIQTQSPVLAMHVTVNQGYVETLCFFSVATLRFIRLNFQFYVETTPCLFSC